MAGASMKDIKLRIRSVQNTMQITKAMQLVAASKLRGARHRMEQSRPFLQYASETLSSLAAHHMEDAPIYLKKRPVKTRCFVVIAGDRGLAGSYNANVLRFTEAQMDLQTDAVVTVGKKAGEYFQHRGARAIDAGVEKIDGIRPAKCEEIAQLLLAGYADGRWDEVHLIYTTFRNVLSQKPTRLKLLPLEPRKTENSEKEPSRQMIFEPGMGSVLESFMPVYLSGVLYAGACDSCLSEQAARRVAMDSATKNAEEMIEQLTLSYNQARQSSITQEITEIVAGAEQ